MDDARINKAVGAELRAARARRGWTRDELHERSGVSVISIRRYEDGIRSVPVDTFVRLIEALGVDTADIERAICRASLDDSQEASGRAIDESLAIGVGELESDSVHDDGEQVG